MGKQKNKPNKDLAGKPALQDLDTIATHPSLDEVEKSARAVGDHGDGLIPQNENRSLLLEPSEDDSSLRTFADPFEALWLAEHAQARNFLKVIVALTLIIFALYPFYGGNPSALRLLLGGAGAGLLVSVLLLWNIRKPESYTLAKLLGGGVFMLTCAWTGTLYFGVYSPAPAIFVIGIYFFSTSSNLAVTTLVYASCAFLQGATVLLFETQLIGDPGAITGAAMTQASRLSLQFLVQFLFFASFVMGRLRRKNMILAIRKLEDAARMLSGRDALLNEANRELNAALQVGGEGRYTGQTLGSFSLGDLLGRGSMGEVYAAKDKKTGTTAAIKVLGAHASTSPDFLKRFLREMKAVSSIDTPYVVRVLEASHTDGGIPYLAMERLIGSDLAQILREKNRLSPNEVCTLVSQIGTGIEAARIAGIVHRDIKPQNLFLAQQPNGNPVWKILDFGVSKLQNSGGTLTEGVVGTPAYMAPEQARGKTVDYRSDLYSLAAVAYRALTGRPAFLASDIPSTMYDVVYSMPIRPTALVDLPNDMDDALLIGIAKDPNDRYATGQDFGHALHQASTAQLNQHTKSHAADVLEKHPWKDTSNGADGLSRVLFR